MVAGSASRGRRLRRCGIKRDDHAGAAAAPGRSVGRAGPPGQREG
jgi:hypothetical protein